MTFGMRHLGQSIRLAGRFIARSFVPAIAATVLLGTASGSAATSVAQPPQCHQGPPAVSQPVSQLVSHCQGEQPVAIQEVRLRKLHLVRPDLIPYPVFYDIYC